MKSFALILLGISISFLSYSQIINTMDNEKLKTEVIAAEEKLLGLLRKGNLMEGVAIHLNIEEYRNIWNGENKTYQMLEERIKKGIANGVTSIDYQVAKRDFMFIADDFVLTTLTATDTTHMKTGEKIISGTTTISILWKRVEGQWRLAYLHASELPK